MFVEGVIREIQSGLALRPPNDVLYPHGTGLAGNFPSAAEQDQGGNAADPILSTQFGLSFGIDLCQPVTRFEGVRRLGKLGSHHLAGTTPGRPEINQQGNIVALEVPSKVERIQLQRIPIEKGLTTLSTYGMFTQFA